MKSFFLMILTGCAEVPKVLAQPAKNENFQPLNHIHLTAPCKNGVDFVLNEIYGFFRTIRHLTLLRVRIFRAFHGSFSIFRQPLINKISLNSFCNFQFDKGRAFYEKV